MLECFPIFVSYKIRFLHCILRFMMFSAGDMSGLLAGPFITRTLLLRSLAIVIEAVCGLALSF